MYHFKPEMSKYLTELSDYSKADLELKNGVRFLSVVDEKLTIQNSIVTIAADRGTGKTFVVLEWAFRALDNFQPNNELDGTKALINTLFYFDLDDNQGALNDRKQVDIINLSKNIFYFDKTKMRQMNKLYIKEYDEKVKGNTQDVKNITEKDLIESFKKWNSKSDKRLLFRNIADAADDLSGALFIIDCLNNIVGDVKDDAKCADFYDTLDDLKSKGAIIIVLAHTIKARDEKGEPQIAGSHEIQDGSDFVYLLIRDKMSKDENFLRFNLVQKKRAYL